MGDVTAALPTGTRDVLPVEAAELGEIEGALCDAFASFGYRRVATPALELAGVLDRAQEGGLGAAYRLFDERGRVLALRPDLTVPAARLIATRMADHPGPVRVSYVASAFRPPTPGRAEAAEQRLAGVELVGADGPAADAEAIAVLAAGLGATGLSGFRVGLGSVELTGAVLGALALSEEAEARLRAALRARDHVTWREAASAAGVGGDAARVLAALPGMRGGAEVLEWVSAAVPDAAPAAERLRHTLELLDRHGGRDAVVIDLGVMRDWPYYSGVVIEAYAPDVGAPVAMGGRYDGLAARFGRPRPAVGVAIALEALHRGLAAQRADAEGLHDGVVLVGGMDDAVEAARATREAGIPVVALPRGSEEAEALAAAERWRFVARPDGAGYAVHDVARDERFTCQRLAEGLASRAA